MYRLISFLSTQRNLILFLVLEVVAFRLLVTYNDHQRHQFGDRMYEVAASMHDVSSSFQDFRRRAAEYDERVVEIKGLKETVDSLQGLVRAYEESTRTDTLDSIRVVATPPEVKESYSYIPCRVVRNSVDKIYNYITIDKGTEDGIEPNMGVIAPDGIVGRVIKVGPRYSLILSALNVGFKLTLQTVSGDSLSESIGVYEWDGRRTSEARLTFIPETVLLQEGTSVVTSGYSTLFPAGYPVGKVKEIGVGGEDGFYDATIELSTDFHRLGTVFCIKAHHRAEIDSLSVAIPEP